MSDEAVDPDAIGAARAMFWARMMRGDSDAAVWAVAFALMENADAILHQTYFQEGIAERCDEIATELCKLRRRDPE